MIWHVSWHSVIFFSANAFFIPKRDDGENDVERSRIEIRRIVPIYLGIVKIGLRFTLRGRAFLDKHTGRVEKRLYNIETNPDFRLPLTTHQRSIHASARHLSRRVRLRLEWRSAYGGYVTIQTMPLPTS